MKKTLLAAAAVIALATSCSGNKNSFVIEGKFDGLNAGMVYLFDEQENVLDSAAVENGAFKFKGTAEVPGMRYILDTRDTDAQATFFAQLYIEPGTISIVNDVDDTTRTSISGTPANDARKAYEAAGAALIKEFRDSTTTDDRREAIEDEYDALTRKTMEANRTNYLGAMLLARQIAYELTGAEVLAEIALFSPELQQTEALTKLKENASQKIKTEVGQPYINIEQPNAEGQIVSLKSVIENPAVKYTLIDFWASWCGPCMGEVPYLLKDYAAYKAKGFEIYGVSFDKDRQKWLDAIKANNMNWIHVSEVKGFDNQAAKDYAIQGIPSNFLIDAQGKIIATNLRGEDLGEKLKELLGE